ncbi:anaerobic sulfatase-maturation protein [Dysgonomonas sp. Marseille-P4677]|uniref:anaerobic sulfatase-maturation protein n=1 Tax=Dysgonomonas sp. Marseille-P4677 TaxID=2364790 RepID=UPI00191167DA|nr:anaerobic sulfatase-maturation protein [Dysgonomonas sp. Marseille-P4677]MBK5721138.1 anaerobic sulfatase-maturation protein [Dysgonomonas sp. Marseille-P4677]
MLLSTHISPFARPLYVMLKPIGAVCNLRCKYCYYLEKKGLYPQVKDYVMSDEILERFIEQYLNSQTMEQVLFTWHGGETLMRNKSFYEKALNLQRKYGRGRHIDNCIQTNGTLLTDDWCKFFKDNNFLVGISVDGPQHCHDVYRKTRDNRPSFYNVMKGLSLLKKHNVEFNIMGVVNDYNVNYPLEFYNFFKSIDCRYIQFAPIVEQVDGAITPWCVPSGKWGNFLIAIFDEWVKQDVGEYYIQYFDSTLANWVGVQPGICTLAKTCGHAGVMEFNGDVYACDHFVYPEYKIGNIHTQTLTEMMYSDKQLNFGNNKFDKLPKQCKECDYLFACYGECPKNRIIKTASGEDGLNYLCEGYYKFFKHVAPYMNFMKDELDNKRPPSNVMEAIRNGVLK